MTEVRQSNIRDHAIRELTLAGMLGENGDQFDEYNDLCGKAVLELIEVFINQGHSGMSASIVLGMFNQVADWKPLSPLTNSPDEWMEVHEDMYQNLRRPDAFSTDGGLTYYLVSDPTRQGWRRKLLGMGRKYYTSGESA